MTDSEYIDKLFKDAGWFEGRFQVIENKNVINCEVQNRALKTLSEYSSLHISELREGRECAAGDITFLEQLNGMYVEVSQPWSSVGRLVLVALAHSDYIGVFINKHGKFYFYTDIDEKLYFGGNNLREAASKLLLGLDYGQSLQANIRWCNYA
jgi:hypothetical protein